MWILHRKTKEILHRHTKEILFSAKVDTIKKLVGLAYFSQVDLSYANLSGADLTGINVSLIQANLTGADLSYADLSNSVLSSAKLSGADLTRADLSGALVCGADLSGANLTGADLTGANFNEAILDGINLEHATIPQREIVVRDTKTGALSFIPERFLLGYPMSCIDKAREYLLSKGHTIVDEKTTCSGDVFRPRFLTTIYIHRTKEEKIRACFLNLNY